MKRREFVKNTVLASSLAFVPSFLRAFEDVEISNLGYKRLVIIHLNGGNDGLNTIVPYNNDIYYNLRPKIALKKNKLIKINDEVGFHKSLLPLKGLYDSGELAIINNVGYPNPSRSHFRSRDIWHTASLDKHVNSGWIGRYIDNYGSKAHSAIQIDDNLTLALRGEIKNGIATKNAEQLYRSLQESDFKTILSYQTSQHLNEHNLGYLYQTMIDANSSAKYIYETSNTIKASDNYPKNTLANQLRTAAQFINSRLETKVIYTTLSGFDTHASQLNTQERLLANYADSIKAFVQDLKRNNTFNDTLILTFSEFGRRVKQNHSNGTDHGTANQVFIVGNKLKKQGFYNNLPSLNNLDNNGDLKYEIDFRTIYATVLKKWLNVNDEKILDKNFKTLDFI
ncbi:DUF1501 domain-containing protein [Lacinutrix salivirga]